MAQIGTFTRDEDGSYTGTIRTLSLNIKVRFIPAEPSQNEKAPDLRVLAGNNVEIGAAWKRSSKENTVYHSVKLDDLAEAARAGKFADYVIRMENLLPNFPRVNVLPIVERRVRHGDPSTVEVDCPPSWAGKGLRNVRSRTFPPDPRRAARAGRRPRWRIANWSSSVRDSAGPQGKGP